MKIVLEVDVKGLQDRVSERVKKRELSLDRLATGIPVSRETVRRVVVGKERVPVNTVLFVCSQVDINPQEVKELILDAVNDLDFEAIVREDGALTPQKTPRKVQSRKSKSMMNGSRTEKP